MAIGETDRSVYEDIPQVLRMFDEQRRNLITDNDNQCLIDRNQTTDIPFNQLPIRMSEVIQLAGADLTLDRSAHIRAAFGDSTYIAPGYPKYEFKWFALSWPTDNATTIARINVEPTYHPVNPTRSEMERNWLISRFLRNAEDMPDPSPNNFGARGIILYDILNNRENAFYKLELMQELLSALAQTAQPPRLLGT